MTGISQRSEGLAAGGYDEAEMVEPAPDPGGQAMLHSSNPTIDRLISFFYLPDLYHKIIINKDFKKSGKRSRYGVAQDLLTLFFSYKTYPYHYLICQLWEAGRSEWKYFYGYGIYQKSKLYRTVEPSEYLVVFDDKAVCELLCRGIGVHCLPHTYGLISPDQNYKERIRSWFQNSATASFIIKPLRGHGGGGIVLAKNTDATIVIQSKSERIPLEDFQLTKPATVQEMIQQDARMAAFSSSSVNTLRVLTMFRRDESVIVLAASMLCGVGESYVSNKHAGGVGIGIDIKTGRLMKYAYLKGGTRYTEHPTSHVPFEGFSIPRWQRIIELAITVQKACPFYRILGTDFAIGEDGEPIVVEVNNDPDLMGQEQSCGPLLKAEENLKAFGEYDLFINRHQKELYEKYMVKM